ncbi:MAG: glycosyltransferase [FCB group bacterium]|nr:glycosyltransferase [FCB group bacterium]
MNSSSVTLPSVSVLIVNYNVRDYIIHCIQSVRQSDYSGTVEIIVVDNHSFDDSVAMIRKQFPEITVLANATNRGFGKAVNQAAEKATGDYFLILNPDTVVQENSISRLITYVQTHPEIGMVGPKILNADGTLQPACKRSFPTLSVALPKILGLSSLFPKSRWAGKYNLTYLDENQPHSVDAVSGSCMLVPKTIFHEVGGFDPAFFMFGEDLDLCYRIKTLGKEIHYTPTTQIVHYQGESVKSAPFDSLNAFYTAMIHFSEKHFSRTYSFLTRRLISIGIRIRRLISLLGEWRTQIISLTLDALVVLAAFLISIPLRFDDFEPITSSSGLVPGIYILFWLGVNAVFQLYSRYILSYSRAILSSLTGFLLAVVFTYFFKQYAFSRLVILVATLIITLLIPGWRVLVHYLISQGWFRSVKDRNTLLFTRKTVIIGTDQESRRIARHLLKRFDTGLDVVGFSDIQLKGNSGDLPAPFLGFVEDLRAIVNKYHIRELIFSTRALSYEEIVRIMDLTKELKLTYRMVPRNRDILLGKASIEEIGDYSFMNIEYPLFYRLHRFTKRLFDILLALILSIIFLPVTLVLWVVRGMKSVRFWGENDTTFRGFLINSRSRFLQSLPLFLTILQGNLSFVGARLIPADGEKPGLICRPGLTGLDRIRNVDLNTEEHNALDRYYMQHQSFTLDLEILVKSLVH